jgi:hypothetical protein
VLSGELGRIAVEQSARSIQLDLRHNALGQIGFKALQDSAKLLPNSRLFYDEDGMLHNTPL